LQEDVIKEELYQKEKDVQKENLVLLVEELKDI